ncbi:MAG: flagellar hook-basal body complex protein [Pseudomonadales bacterium]
MSIYGTIYNSTTGLLTFSKGLDTISNNVANLNTPGFKRNDLLFRDLFYQHQLTGEFDQDFSSFKDGNGVTDGGTITSFAQGDIQQSGNDTDVAVNGNGFFILRNDAGTFYSRVGQFEIGEDGYLISSGNDARVAGIGEAGNLVDINIDDLRISPAGPTTEVTFIDNVSSGAVEHVINDIEVFDALGTPHLLSMTLANNSTQTPRSWLAEIKNEQGDVIASDLDIRFQGNGSLEVDFNSFTFTFEPEDVAPGDITFFFGEPNAFTASTSFSAGASSDLKMDTQDGFAFGSQISVTFNRDGVLEIEYTNGETEKGGRLALAWLNDLQAMRQIGNGLFEIDDHSRLHINAANEGVMGEIMVGSIEISNVELSQEFTDLVIVQRGFQVSSQVLSIANEMLQQLIDSSGSGR